jgi:hypothetical protein
VTPQAIPPTARTFFDLHVRNNDRTAGLWELYAGHRERVSELLSASAPAGRDARLAVLGAGNANDLDLAALARRFMEIHLADVDGRALARALRRQTEATRASLVLHPGRDLSGLVDLLPAWSAEPPEVAVLARAAPAAGARVAASLPGPFDVVVSDCLLSQLSWTCYQGLGEGPLLMNVLDVAMAAHLRALLALARPGGRCWLVTDVASSDTVPLERLVPEGNGEHLLWRLAEREELFSGTNPLVARLMLTRDPELARNVEDVSMPAPWLWRISSGRTVLVYALGFTRRA